MKYKQTKVSKYIQRKNATTLTLDQQSWHLITTIWLDSCYSLMAFSLLQFQQCLDGIFSKEKQIGGLQQFFYPHQEADGFAAVDDAVVIAYG